MVFAPNIAQRLELKQAQALTMTPQLRQAIELLQMSSQEIQAYVAEEVEKNPLLEQVFDARDIETKHPDFSLNIFSNKEKNLAIERSETAISFLADTAEFVGKDNWGEATSVGAAYGIEAEAFSYKMNIDETDEFLSVQKIAKETNLREHLISQIHMDFTDSIERMIAVSLVDLIDENGYLPANLDLVRTQLGVSQEKFESIVKKLQQLDPPGIFARSLAECLEIQLREKNRFDPAMDQLLQNLDLLAKHDTKALMKICKVSLEELEEMIHEIRTLNPKPASTLVFEMPPSVIPDIILYPLPGGGWQVELNSDALPRVLANEEYYLKIRNSTRNLSEKEYLREKWNHANWLTRALHQRATTILKVAAEIVKRQDDFFVYGVQHLKPLVLRDIAEALGLHESTVSRVTRNKYIATPRGIFELRYFFSGAIATTGGVENVSATAVRQRIREIINAETPDAILSDDQIVTVLRLEGINIARRTVAKYRESMRIPSSAQRRREKKRQEKNFLSRL